MTGIFDVITEFDLDKNKLITYRTFEKIEFPSSEIGNISHCSGIPKSTINSWRPECQGARPVEIKLEDYLNDNEILIDEQFNEQNPLYSNLVKLGFLTYFTGSRITNKHNNIRLTISSAKLSNFEKELTNLMNIFNSKKIEHTKTTKSHTIKIGDKYLGSFIRTIIPSLQYRREKRLKTIPKLAHANPGLYLKALILAKGKKNCGINVNLTQVNNLDEFDNLKQQYEELFAQLDISGVVCKTSVKNGYRADIYFKNNKLFSLL